MVHNILVMAKEKQSRKDRVKMVVDVPPEVRLAYSLVAKVAGCNVTELLIAIAKEQPEYEVARLMLDRQLSKDQVKTRLEKIRDSFADLKRSPEVQ